MNKEEEEEEIEILDGTELRANSQWDLGNRKREMLSVESPSLAPAMTPVAGLGFLAKKFICSRSWSLDTSLDPLNTYVLGICPNPNSWTCTKVPNVISPSRELSGNKSMAWDSADLRKSISSSMTQVSTTNMKTGGGGAWEDEGG